VGRGLPEPTARGRGFLAGGVTVILCATVLGQGTLVRVGVLLLVLPVLAWALLALRPREVTVSRVIATPVVAAGRPFDVELVVVARAGHGVGTMLVEEQLPFALGARPRFALRPAAEQRLRYTARSDVRGRFLLGPLTTRATDLFGLVQVRRTVPGTAAVVVTPPVVPLPVIGLGRGRSSSGEQLAALAAAGTAEDVAVREYRQGDDLRRVHWRSSARVGELMVRREENPWEARATILLDNRECAHAGHARGSSLEAAVVVAASVAVHLDRHGYVVDLVTADGPATSRSEQVGAVLEHLALVALSARPLLTADVGDPHRHGTVVGVFGVLTAADAQVLRRLRQYAGSSIAVALDAYQWQHRNAGPSDASSLLLRDLGWRATPVGRHDRIEQVWRSLDLRQGARR